MSEDRKNNTFQYTYSAKEQEELRRIRSKYAPKEEDKLEQLRRLDRQVTSRATAYSIAVGVIGALILGTGMSCCMVWAGAWFIPGIILGLAGMAVTALAYPIYNRTLRRERERIAPVILSITEELLK